MVPQWDGNPDILARWISKINCLANNLPEINEELGKIVPQRFTNFAKTWYYSIPDVEHIRIEENWTTLKKGYFRILYESPLVEEAEFEGE